MDEKHEGWTNRETWLVNQWIENDPGSHFYWTKLVATILAEHTRDEAVRLVAESLEEWCDEQMPKVAGAPAIPDLLQNSACFRVEWQEIAESMIANAQEQNPFGPVIYAYTRKQALADGVLVDASKLAAEAGITVPVALTSAVWELYVKVPDAVPWQDETGRLWDILHQLRYAIRAAKGNSTELLFKVFVQNDEGPPKPLTLKAISGPGDDAEHVLTIMLPNED